MGLNKLPDKLKDIARIRLEFTDATLNELSQMLSNRISKSGVNHRLRKLDEIAEDIREREGLND